MLQRIRSTVPNTNGSESRPAQISAPALKALSSIATEAHPKMHLRIPKSPLTVIGDTCQAESVPLAGHIEVAAKPVQHQDITSVQLQLLRTTKIKKPATKPQDALLPSRRRSFGNRSPTRDKRTCVEELMQWTVAYSPSPMTADSSNKQRRNLLPFNVRIPGHLPASTSTPVASTSYALAATAVSRATGKPLFKTETPLVLRRALHLPEGPAEVSLRRRFPDSLMSTRLALPGVLRPTDDFTARLTLCGSISQRGRTTTRLAVRRLDWRIEERAAIVPVAEAGRLPPFSEIETGATNAAETAQQKKETQQHIRKLASGGWTGNLDKLPKPAPSGEVDTSFTVTLPASARASCGVEPDTMSNTAAAGDDHSALSVSHVLVLELITAELKYSVDTGELVNMYPFPQRKFGAVYDITVSNWDYANDGGNAAAAALEGQFGTAAPSVVLPPTSTAFHPTIPPYCEIFGEMPPSYDSVAVM
ncbi:arrestin (or s-antigen) n-terminal domain protein [Diplodia corticola]|uniref:Arrestin (Or s-antigen) n-terminal domain protein n=1 Tax=Diplodia corticola TaxID=236234 RepID=A0A1J9RPJ8_9PEZI|nr:arrestin (or s-antigen) n-terminal domain protein [Diplodia corticola]OJD34483.1 arrestin (or s-antigen) n-terminal domain protein [Diplodia corticola]